MTEGEKKVLTRALKDLRKAGWEPYRVEDDGEDVTVSTDEQVLAVVGAVDDPVIRVRRPLPGGQTVRSWLRVILGNAPSGEEVIAEHGVTLEDALAAYYSEGAGV